MKDNDPIGNQVSEVTCNPDNENEEEGQDDLTITKIEDNHYWDNMLSKNSKHD